MLRFSAMDRRQAPLRRCGQSRALQPAALVEVPNVSPANSEIVSKMGEQFGELLQYYYNITISGTVTSCVLLIYSLKKES